MTLMTDVPADAPPVDAPPPADAPPADAPPAGVEPPADAPPVDAKPEGAPEAYEWKLPEGVDFDESGLQAFGEFAKESGLTNDAANALLGKMAPVMAERQRAAQAAMIDGWLTQSQSDQEFGGAKLQENIAVAKKAMDQFGTPELTTLLNESGLGNHPEIIRAFYRAGKAISEDRFIGGNRASQVSDDPAKRLYPNLA